MQTNKVSAALQNSLDKITQINQSSKDLKQTEADLTDLSRIITKVQDKHKQETVQTVIDHIFTLARDKMESEHDKKVLAGLRQMLGQVELDLYRPQARFQDAFFFPNMANVKKMVNYINMAKKSIDLAIFSFTNDDLANAIIDAHQRGVTVRIITDDEAMKGNGADAQRCSDAGILVRTDNEVQYHMHNKFMVVDSLFLVTGSFNWTFQAGKSNQENVVVVDGEYYINKYNQEFNKLWSQFADNELERKQAQAATKIQKQFRSKQAAQVAVNKKKRVTNDPWGLE
jgi:phosphatidylserine/phosphatidylglycerophosphate/cardiolipin synthase-like enzyme